MASWFDDMNDRELLDLIPFLEQLSTTKSTLRHHVAIASQLAPPGGKPSLAKPASTALVPKGERARQLAKDAGHHLNAQDTCIACGASR